MKYELPTLDYEYNALEPHIDEQTMKIHHQKHHNAYLEKFKAAVKGTVLDGKPVEEILSNPDTIPAEIKTAVINNGGGYANHNMFWKMMSPDGGGEPSGKLAEEIKRVFGSFDAMKELFNKAAVTRFGSGWAWLGLDEQGKLHVGSTANQDSPLSKGHIPLLCLDVWEHSYYLKYQNKRPDYIEAFWNVVNWKEVEKRFEEAK